VDTIFRQVTAFTHPRRIAIVRALKGQRLTEQSLLVLTGISRDAIHRHLRKLVARGVVIEDAGAYWLARQDAGLATTLLALATGP
jgi:biotin operon repressor